MNEEKLNELKKMKQWIIDNEMPYLNCGKNSLKQLDGTIVSIADMNSTDLQYSMKKMKNEINTLQHRPSPIREELIKLVEKKIKEIKKELDTRI